MSNNFNSDSLESFFQKGLQDDLLTDIESDGWDMPSDAVWDNIETGITVRQIRGKKWGDNKPWLSVAAAILFITIFYQTLSQQQNIDGLQNQIDAQANRIEQIDEHTNQSNDFQNNIVSIPTTEPVLNQTSTTKNTNNLVAAASQNRIAKNNNNNSIAPPTQNIIVASKPEDTAVSNQINHTNYLSTEFVKQQISINSKEMAALNLSTTQLNVESDFYQPQYVTPILKKSDRKRMYAGTYLGTNWTSTKVKGSGEIKDLLNKEQFSTTSYQAGVKIGYQLSDKWSVETGLAYNKIQQQSDHQLQFVFDSDDISLNGSGEYEATYAGNLSTSYGTMPVDVVLSHGTTAPTLQEGQVLPFTLKSKQDLEMVQVPVAVRYAVGSGRLKLHLSAGATANILTNKDLKLTLPIEGFPLPDLANVTYKNSELESANYLDDINNLTLSLTAGAELEYALTDNLHLYATPTYSKGVTPIYESEEVDTELSQASVLLGLNYYF